MEWIATHRDSLEAMPPPDEDASALQQQIEENKVAFCAHIHVAHIYTCTFYVYL